MVISRDAIGLSLSLSPSASLQGFLEPCATLTARMCPSDVRGTKNAPSRTIQHSAEQSALTLKAVQVMLRRLGASLAAPEQQERDELAVRWYFHWEGVAALANVRFVPIANIFTQFGCVLDEQRRWP